jgi:hypothetical protein
MRLEVRFANADTVEKSGNNLDLYQMIRVIRKLQERQISKYGRLAGEKPPRVVGWTAVETFPVYLLD